MSATMEDARAALLSDDPARQAEGARTVRRLHRQGDPLAAYKAAAPLPQYAVGGGVADAAYDLAVLVGKERVGPRSRRVAFGYHVLASVLGSQNAPDEVGRCFYRGIGTYKNRDIAERLIALGDPQTQLAAE